MIEIDGSYGEGGGQIIRTSVALSALTKKPVRIYNIRANRKPNGLRPQHLTAVKAVADICNAKLSGAEVGSTEIIFEPDNIKGGSFSWDIGTAGSITLVLQALLPAAIFSKKEFTFDVIGGTNVTMCPPIEYLQHIFCDYLEKMGAKLKLEISKYGFYPKGGGRVKLRIQPAELHEIKILKRGKLLKTDIWSIASKELQKAQVAERQVKGFKHGFGETKYDKIHEDYVDTFSIGSSIHAHNHYENCKLGAESLGKLGKPAEKVGEECAKKLLAEIDSESTLDSHMTDQIIPYIGMLGGEFRADETSSHTKTNIWVSEQFLPVLFVIKEGILTCKNLSKN